MQSKEGSSFHPTKLKEDSFLGQLSGWSIIENRLAAFYIKNTIHWHNVMETSLALAKLNACLRDVQEWMSLSKKQSFLSLVPRLNVRRFPLTFLSAFLVAFFIQLLLSEI